ncbi:MAG: C4-dicarboxylate ABC transporter substrate-binding protein [Clostridiaceae bacterium BRH_c20a]|nr:MAG: C4-dicarboxylate ABC transporter substrate-binding protein [Clostridiaceae bacterium BRH_c20a]
MKLKNNHLLILLCLVLAISLVTAGCGGTKEPAPAPAPEKSEPVETADPKANWPKTLDLGAASIGGAYYVYAGGISTVVEEIVGIPVGVEVTGGPNHNMQLVDIGDLDLGMVTMGPAYEAWNGLEDWTGGKEHKNVRAIFPMYSTYSQWWAEKGAGITNIHDLEGKRVGAGPSGGTAGTFHPRFLELLGIKATIVNAGLSDLVSQHLDKQLDANSFASGVPVAGVLEYSAQKDTVFFGVDGEDRDKILAEWPFWAKAVVPKDKYDFLDKDVETVAIWNVAIANKDLEDSLVYEIVKAIMENNKMMLDAHSAAAETVPENLDGNTFMWMHPGAIKYFEEIGIKVNPDLYPPEYKK